MFVKVFGFLLSIHGSVSFWGYLTAGGFELRIFSLSIEHFSDLEVHYSETLAMNFW